MKKIFSSGTRAEVNTTVLLLSMLTAGLVAGSLLTLYASANLLKNTKLPDKNAATYPSRDNRGLCDILVCPNGNIFQTCAYSGGAQVPIAYFNDPCKSLEQNKK